MYSNTSVTEYLKTFSAMNSNDLFSFLEDGAEDQQVENEEPMAVDATSPSPKSLQKRKADSPPPANLSTTNGHVADELPNGEGPSAPKKARISSPQPQVLDDFETEAKREVAASAGLVGTEAEAGSRLELRHQVRYSYLLSCTPIDRVGRSDTKWLFLQAITTSLYPSMSLPRSRIASTNSS